MHIIAGLPSTSTLLDTVGVPLVGSTSIKRDFKVNGSTYGQLINDGKAGEGMPTQQGMDKLAEEARAIMEVNYMGTVLALACFVSSLHEINNSGTEAYCPASSACIHVKKPGTPSPIFRCSHVPCSTAEHIYCYQSCRFDGCRRLPCRM